MTNKFLFLVPVFLAILLATGCSSDPDAAKRRYIENGNKYFEQGLHKQASIMYRNALKRDQRFGEAWYRLGLTQLKLQDFTGAYGSLRRAAELQPENLDARAQIADILIQAYRGDPRNRQQYLQEIETLLQDERAGLLKTSPEAFETYRIDGSYDLLLAAELIEGLQNKSGSEAQQDRTRAMQLFESATDKLRKANQRKPDNPAVVLTLARTLALTNHFDEAEKLATGLLEKQKDALLAYEFLFTQYVARQRFDDAANILRQAEKNHPQADAFPLQLAAFFQAQKKEDEARRVLDQYIQRAEDKAFAHMRVGDYWSRTKNMERANAHYKSALEAAESKNPLAARNDIRKRMADAMMAQGRTDEARKLLEEVLKESPEDAQAATMHAGLLLRGGSREEIAQAIQELEAAVSRAPDNHVLHFNLANAYLNKAPAEPDRARVQLEEAVRIRKSYMPAHIRLTQMLIQQGQYGAAEAQAKEALEQAPDNITARELLAMAQIEVGNLDAARENLSTVLRLQPNALGAKYQLGRIALQQNKLDEAEKIFREVHEASPQDPLVRGLAGIVETYKRRGQVDKALDLVDQELKRNPDRFTTGLLAGDTAYLAKQYDRASDHFDRMLAKYPQNPDLWSRRGETARVMGDLDKALKSFEKAVQLNPDRKAPLLLLAIMHMNRGETDKARYYYEEVLKRDPEEPIALNNLAFLMVEKGDDLERALSMVQRAKQRLPQNDEISDTLGWIYLKKNLHENAVQIFDELVKNQPKNPTFRYHLGMAHFQAGDRSSARQALETALKNGPSKQEEEKIRALLNQIG